MGQNVRRKPVLGISAPWGYLGSAVLACACVVVLPAEISTAEAPAISVATFDATPNDALDDTAGIQSAFDAAARADAATHTVLIPAGTYSVDPDRLTVPQGVSVNGPGAVLAASGQGSTLLATRGGTSLSSLQLDGRDLVVRGLKVTAGSSDVRITGVKVTNIASPVDPSAPGYAATADQVVAGIDVEGDTDHVTIERTVVDRVRAAVPVDRSVETVGDFETTPWNAGWAEEHAADAQNRWLEHSRRLVTTPVRAGRFAIRQQVDKADPMVNSGLRSEFTQPAVGNTSEHWYGFSMYLPKGGPEDFATDPSPEIVAQWHSTPDDRNVEKVSPPLSLLTKAGRWSVLRIWDPNRISTNPAIASAGTYETTDLGSYAADKGRWTDWVFHVKWGWKNAQDPVTEIWKNGRLVYSRQAPNAFNDAVGPYFKMGIYKWEWNPGFNAPVPSTTTSRVIYHDEFRMAGPEGSVAAVSVPTMPMRDTVARIPTARGIWLHAAAGQAAPAYVTVRSSTISNVGPKDDGDGLVIQAAGPTTTDAHLVVTQNTFSAVAKRAVKIQVPGATVTGNRIVNSWLGNNPYYVRPAASDKTDMHAYISVYAPYVTVASNTVSGTGSVYAGIDVGRDADHVTITGNTLVNGPASRTGPSSLIRFGAPVAGLTLAKNVLRNSARGITCAGPISGTVGIQTLRAVSRPWSGCFAAPTLRRRPVALMAAGGTRLTITHPDLGATRAEYAARSFRVKVNGVAAQAVWTAPRTLRVIAPAGRIGRASLVLFRAGNAFPAVPLPAYRRLTGG